MACFWGNCSKNLHPADSADVYPALTICQGFLYTLQEALAHFRNKETKTEKSSRTCPKPQSYLGFQSQSSDTTSRALATEPSQQAFWCKDQHQSSYVDSSLFQGPYASSTHLFSVMPYGTDSIMIHIFQMRSRRQREVKQICPKWGRGSPGIWTVAISYAPHFFTQCLLSPASLEAPRRGCGVLKPGPTARVVLWKWPLASLGTSVHVWCTADCCTKG